MLKLICKSQLTPFSLFFNLVKLNLHLTSLESTKIKPKLIFNLLGNYILWMDLFISPISPWMWCFSLRHAKQTCWRTVPHLRKRTYCIHGNCHLFYPPCLFLLQGFVSLCTRLLPVKLLSFQLLPSQPLSPNPQTSMCRTWAHATTEPAQTSTAWSLRTYEPHSQKMTDCMEIHVRLAL